MNNSNLNNKVPIPVLYFSMACNEQTWNEIQRKSKVKGSIAPLVFDSLMLKGLNSQSKISVSVYSFPSVPAYPNSTKFSWGCNKEKIEKGLFTRWVPTINVPNNYASDLFFLSFLIILFWLIRNINQKRKEIVIYSPFFPISFSIIFLARISGVSCTVIVADIHHYWFLTNRRRLLIRLFENSFVKLTEIVQARFDKYVFLTEQMNELINKKTSLML